jgi:hypothetical protein
VEVKVSVVNNVIIYKIRISDYISYDLLEENEMNKLIDNAINWMKQEGIEPIDEGIHEEKSSKENYEKIYNNFIDDPKLYFKDTLGLDVKNIED